MPARNFPGRPAPPDRFSSDAFSPVPFAGSECRSSGRRISLRRACERPRAVSKNGLPVVGGPFFVFLLSGACRQRGQSGEVRGGRGPTGVLRGFGRVLAVRWGRRTAADGFSGAVGRRVPGRRKRKRGGAGLRCRGFAAERAGRTAHSGRVSPGVRWWGDPESRPCRNGDGHEERNRPAALIAAGRFVLQGPQDYSLGTSMK